jgi:hypothetical protein
MWFVNIFFWLQAFASPVILSGLLILAVQPSEGMIRLILVAGAVLGIVLAEYIRRKIGLSVFFGRIYGPNEMDKKKEN